MTKQHPDILYLVFILIFAILFTACIPQLIPSISSTAMPQETESTIPAAADDTQMTETPSPTTTLMAIEAVSWRALGNADPFINVIAIHPLNSSILYAGSHNTIFRSETGGENWKTVYTFEGGQEDTIANILIDPVNPQTIYAAIYNQGIFKSTDDGLTWLPINYGLDDKTILTMEMNPANSSILYAGTENGLYQSKNKGKIWEKVGQKFAGERINCIAVDPFSPSTIFVGTTRLGLFKSIDSGESWEQANVGLYIKTESMETESPTWVYDIAINPIDPETIYAAGYGVFKSTDGGFTWQAINNGLADENSGSLRYINYIQINPHAPDTLYAVSSRDTLFRSDDGGSYWYTYNYGINNNAAEGPISAVAFDPYQATTLYIGTWRSGAFTTRQTRIYYPSETPTIYDCSLGWSKLKAGEYAYVVGDVDDAPNRVRLEPHKDSEQVGQVFPGMVLKILEGPECSDGLVYWKVENHTIESGSGWTAEGNLQDYWLEPYR